MYFARARLTGSEAVYVRYSRIYVTTHNTMAFKKQRITCYRLLVFIALITFFKAAVAFSPRKSHEEYRAFVVTSDKKLSLMSLRAETTSVVTVEDGGARKASLVLRADYVGTVETRSNDFTGGND